MELFTAADFKVFAISGFQERMTALASRIRPKLASAGAALAPRLSVLVDAPLHVHVAKHARRTVNPPDDTWAALCANPRGYKKHVHFKFAVSRNAVRLLAEIGPEFAAKTDWLAAWNRSPKDVTGELAASGLAFFANEHDEAPRAELKGLSAAEIKQLAALLVKGRDGQFVLGRRIAAADYLKMKPAELEALALATYKPLATLFRVL